MPEHPQSSRASIRVRPYRAEDRAFVVGLAPRLVVGCAPWRDHGRMLATMRHFIEEDADRADGPATLLVAEDAVGERLGFVTIADHVNFTGEPEAYVGELAVRADREGTGAGQALMHAAEDWARAHGYGLVVLETGAANTRARAFYARLGYEEESVKLAHMLA